jgi:hypothetical protein|tara:strand:- start:746 stop:922 length:177 start_codon:yes stop_codon:yes gene_type:complete
MNNNQDNQYEVLEGLKNLFESACSEENVTPEMEDAEQKLFNYLMGKLVRTIDKGTKGT